jgi:phosphoribosyl-AMP cyclohydrolase
MARKPYRPRDNNVMSEHRDSARRPAENNLDPAVAALLKHHPDGLIPAIAQQHDTGEVLMLAWMDDEALHRTLTTGRATYWSRSRGEYWVKGDTSGHVQRVLSVSLDCDGDTILLEVDQTGPACHTGTRTCFDGRTILGEPSARMAP